MVASVHPSTPELPRGSWPLVGRDEELSALLDAIESGSSRVFVLTGAAGVGKSRLATETIDALDARGWPIARVAASAALRSVPLAALVPFVGARRGELNALSEDPAALFAFAADVAAERAAGARLALLVDDLPQLDPLSVALIAQLAHTGSTVVVATARDGDPLPEAILGLWTAGIATRVALDPLTVEQVGKLLDAVLGGPLSHQSTAALHRLSGGNPLMLRELVAAAQESHSLEQSGGMWVLTSEPESSPALAELVRARLSHLSDAEKTVMERLAACAAIPLEHFSGADELEALDSLEQQGIVTLRREGQRHIAAITHPQYIAATRSDLSTLRRIALLTEHVKRAEAAGANASDAVRIASWRLDAGLPADPAVLATAARLAAMSEDFDRAAALARAAADSGSQDVDVMVLHGDALIKLGRVDEALRVLERARQRDADAPRDDHRSARILTLMATALIIQPDRFDEAQALLEGAAERLPAAASKIHLARARVFVAQERPRRALEELDLAGDGDGEDDRGMIALNRVVPFVALTRTPEALDQTERALAAARLKDSTVPLRVAYLMRAVTLVQACRLEDAQRFATDALSEAILRDDELRARQGEITLGACALAAGRLETAARWFTDVIAGARTRGPEGYGVLGRGMLARTRVQQGQVAAARAVLDEIPTTAIEEDSLMLLGWAWVEAAEGRATTARAAIAERAELRRQTGDLDFASILAIDLARLGDPVRGAELLRLIDEESTSPLIALRTRTAVAMADGDALALSELSTEWEQCGFLLHAAETAALAADEAKRRGEGRRASALVTRARALTDRCEGAATGPLQFGDAVEPLTAREREIALLAARGAASNDIASRLFLSPRTVNNHLQSAYGKLGIRSRSELADALGLAFA